MCNLSTGFFEEGKEIGYSNGFSEGQKSGTDSTIIDMIWNYAIKHTISIQKSMEELSITQNQYAYYAHKCETKHGKLN